MGFLTFLGIASAIAYGISTEHKSSIRKYNKQSFLESVNYDVDVVRDFYGILHVCGVKKKEINKFCGITCNNNPPIWPKDGYKYCIPFLKEQPKLTNKDIDTFTKIYQEIRQESLNELQKEHDKTYQKCKNGFLKSEAPNTLTTFEQKHWNHISVDLHQKMADDIYHNTFWNEIATGPAKIIDEEFGRRREIWQVKDYKSTLNTFYLICKEKCGYSDYII